MKVDHFLEKIKKPVYLLTVGSLYLLYFATLIGLFYVKPEYIQIVSNISHTFICLFLIIRFNPFRKHIVLHEFDDKIIFGSALILLFNLSITQYLVSFISKKTDKTDKKDVSYAAIPVSAAVDLMSV
jgi:hypothetical protein